MPPSPAQNLPEGIKGSPDLRTCLLPYLLALGPAVGLFQLRTLSHKGVLFFFLKKKKPKLQSLLSPGLKGVNSD